MCIYVSGFNFNFIEIYKGMKHLTTTDHFFLHDHSEELSVNKDNRIKYKNDKHTACKNVIYYLLTDNKIQQLTKPNYLYKQLYSKKRSLNSFKVFDKIMHLSAEILTKLAMLSLMF